MSIWRRIIFREPAFLRDLFRPNYIPICGRCGQPKSKLCGNDFIPASESCGTSSKQ